MVNSIWLWIIDRGGLGILGETCRGSRESQSRQVRAKEDVEHGVAGGSTTRKVRETFQDGGLFRTRTSGFILSFSLKAIL